MLLTGAIPANVLPFDDDLAIDEPAYRAHLESLVSTPGVGAVTCNGHAGEVSALDRSERARAVAIAAETVAGRVPLVAGIHAENHLEAADLARDAEREGADALLVLPPTALVYDAGGEVAYRQHAAIAEAAPLPQVVFCYPSWTNMRYDRDTFTRILELPVVTAVKDWSLDIATHEANQRQVRAAGHPISFLTSFSTHLLPALANGADGILSGHGSVIAREQAELFAAVREGQLLRARELYARIQVLTEVIYRSPMLNMYARMKEHLIMLGHRLGPAVRPPLWRVDDHERAALRDALDRAGLLQGASA